MPSDDKEEEHEHAASINTDRRDQKGWFLAKVDSAFIHFFFCMALLIIIIIEALLWITLLFNYCWLLGTLKIQLVDVPVLHRRWADQGRNPEPVAHIQVVRNEHLSVWPCCPCDRCGRPVASVWVCESRGHMFEFPILPKSQLEKRRGDKAFRGEGIEDIAYGTRFHEGS